MKVAECGKRSAMPTRSQRWSRRRSTDEDVKGPFLARVPEILQEQSRLDALGYTNVIELLGEKFHVSEALLKRLNPGVDFGRAGQEIVVPNVAHKNSAKVSRIEVDGSSQEVRALAGDGRLIAIYPATVGSSDRPTPVGEFRVTMIAHNPVYHYDPALKFKGVDAKRSSTSRRGPTIRSASYGSASTAKAMASTARQTLRPSARLRRTAAFG